MNVNKTKLSATKGFTIPLRNEFPEFWEFLGIPRDSNLFQDMQMSKDKKTLEYLGILGNGLKHQWEFLGIPRNSQ